MREDAIFEHDLDFLGMVIFLAASELAASCRRVVTWVGLSLHTDLISLAMPLHPLLYIIACGLAEAFLRSCLDGATENLRDTL
jgi:hypothetical protein